MSNKVDNKTDQATNANTGKAAKKKKGPVREWVDSIVFAVVVATFIRWLFIEAYMIPSPSMESSLLVGDYLFVSKMHYGARTPQTPLQIPLTFQKIWGTDIPSYIEAIQLPMLRLPGFSEVKRNDPVVFNYPNELNNPVDVRTYYIKRCVAVSGDVLEVKNQQVYINGQPAENPAGLQTSYIVCSRQSINKERGFHANGIRGYAHISPQGLPNHIKLESPTDHVYVISATQENVDKMKSALDFVYSVEKQVYQAGSPTGGVFSQSVCKNWSIDNFGALEIPKEGNSIAINDENLAKYGHVIMNYEYNDDVEVKEGKLYIDGAVVDQYTFKQDYYFMMGDNRHDSSDSRIWGFVPADHIVGKALFTWWSVDNNESWSNILDKVRWDRIFSLIE